MQKTVITERAINAIADLPEVEPKVRRRLMQRFGILSPATIKAWYSKRDDMLTTPDAVAIISEETGLKTSEILGKVEL